MSASEFETPAVEVRVGDAVAAVLVADAAVTVILHAPYLLLLEHERLVVGVPVAVGHEHREVLLARVLDRIGHRAADELARVVAARLGRARRAWASAVPTGNRRV